MKPSFSPALTQRLFDLAVQLQQIPAPTFQEGQRAQALLSIFQGSGLTDTQIDAAGNVYARLKGGGNGRPLVLSAHLDSVHPLSTPLTLHRHADCLTGPGIGDNALGLAALVVLAEAIRQKNLPLGGDLWLVGNVCEEGLGNLRGIQAVVDRFKDAPLAYLVVEGMALGEIIHQGLGVRRFRVRVQTAGGHSWVDYGQPSAIHELAKIVTRLDQLALPRKPRCTLNVGIIQGGTSVNTIAADAWFDLDIRSEDGTTLDHLVKVIQSLVLEDGSPEMKITFEAIGHRPCGSLPADHPLVRLAQTCLAEAGVKKGRLNISSNDANLPLSRGYPALCLGVTTGEHAHTSEEIIYTQPASQGLQQLFLICSRAWDVLPGAR